MVNSINDFLEMIVSTCFVVAFSTEARPLIEHFRLKRDFSVRSFPLYRNDDILLIVSGLGKVRSSSAVSFVQGLEQDPRDLVWINVGVAGHPSLPVGEGVWAVQVSDCMTKESWYPQFPFRNKRKTTSLVTVDAPDETYRNNTLVDMEGAGFCQAASRFSTMEWVHLFKVISDNREKTFDLQHKQQAAELIKGQIGQIEGFLSAIIPIHRQWREEKKSSPLAADLLERWHFTASQKTQLEQQVNKLPALQLDEVLSSHNAKEVLSRLQEVASQQSWEI